jgi:hypothetical protein
VSLPAFILLVWFAKWPEQVQSVVEALETKRARWLEMEPEPDFPEGPGNHLGPLRSYLHAHYHVVKTFYNGEDQIWERKAP